ncbi:MAG: Crp/Fnr family transcriptional regulator [Clostridiales bacterium]|nr:Crp/Fnr family transcriptional regulator [Clostridiales bacterium]
MNNLNFQKMPSNVDLIGINDCFHPTEREYARNEVITICSSKNDIIGIIKKGTAYLSTINFNDQRRIIDYYQAGDFFGGHLLTNKDNKLYYITAKTKCTVDLISYKKLITCCGNACDTHIRLINNFFTDTVRRANAHIDILGQRTLRDKLTAYFEYLSLSSEKNTFTLPLPLSDLADYLAVDRSAMMREIKKLNEEKVIKSERRRITVFNSKQSPM